MKVEDIIIEYKSPYVAILHSLIREDEGDLIYELEIKNTQNKRIWGINAQLKFYDAQDVFLGFYFDENEQYLPANRNLALGISANPPENTKYAKLTIDAVEEEEEETFYQKYLIEIIFMLVILFSLYNYLR